MSYILDALRKSDLQRQRGAAPTLLAAQAAPAPPRRPPIGVYVLLALLLLGAGIVIGWVRPWQDAPVRHESIVVKGPVPASREPASALSATGPQPAPQSSVPPAQTRPEPARPVTPQTQAPGAPTGSSKPQLPERAARAAPKVKGLPRVTDADAAQSDAVATQPPPVSIKDLPLSIRAELPAMKITVHAWSANPERRLVGIDSRILREGDTVAPGLKLEEITTEGMIFDFKGFRFQRGVK